MGIERRPGRNGIVGVNLFYRDVNDLIELVNTGEPSEDALDGHEDDIEGYRDANGVDEATARAALPFDPDSVIFAPANLGEGRVYGAAFDLSTPLTVFGMEHTGVFRNCSWLQSEVTDSLEVMTTSGGDPERFVEKHFGDRIPPRLSGTNLLAADKDKCFGTFDNRFDQIVRDYDEHEEGRERAGLRYQLVLRYAF